MLGGLVITLTTSYLAWFIQQHEHQVVYPFDGTYHAPAEAGAPAFTEVRHRTVDGETLILWVRAPVEGAPVVLYLPGNAGTLADRTDRLNGLADRGLGVVAMAYRGSNGSTGTPDEARLMADAAEVYMRLPSLAALAPGTPVVLYGESLGAAIAVQLGVGGLGDAVILQSPFTSIRDLVAAQYPQEDLTPYLTQSWDSLAGIPGLRQPLLILHGSEDRLVPIAQGRELMTQAGSRHKRLVELEGYGHAGLWTPVIEAEILNFLGDL